MRGIRDEMRRRPVTWFFAIALMLETAVMAVFLLSGAAEKFDAAVGAAGPELQGRTDFVAAYRLAAEAPQATPGIALSILQPFTPDIAAFVVAGLALGTAGLARLVRGFRFWSAEVGWRQGLRAWGLMFLAFLVLMPLVTAGLDALFMPEGAWEWSGHSPSWSLLPALFITLFLNVGAVSEETGWRGFAQPVLQDRRTPLAAALIVGVLWGIWHFPARPDILAGGYGLYGGILLLGILVARFVFLSIVMAYFYNKAGGSTLIAIAMHGLHNDSVLFSGTITVDTTTSYVISELTLLAPIVVVACMVVFVAGRRLGLEKGRTANA